MAEHYTYHLQDTEKTLMGDITGCGRETSGRVNAYIGSIAAQHASTRQAQQSKRVGNRTPGLHDNISPAFGVQTRCSYQSACQRAPSTYINGGAAAMSPYCAPYVRAFTDPASFSVHPLCTTDTPLST